jgi:hypothetical protein
MKKMITFPVLIFACLLVGAMTILCYSQGAVPESWAALTYGLLFIAAAVISTIWISGLRHG